MSRFEFEHFERFVCVLIATNGALLYPSRQTWVRSQAASSVDSHVPENDRARSRGGTHVPAPVRRIAQSPTAQLFYAGAPKKIVSKSPASGYASDLHRGRLFIGLGFVVRLF